MATTITQQVATLNPGESVVLPAGAKIISIVTEGNITVTNSCGTVPESSSYKCGYFHLELDVDDNDGHSMDEESTLYQHIKVGNTTDVMNQLIVTGENPGSLVDDTVLNTHITNTAVFSFKEVTRNVLSKRQIIFVWFQVPEELFDVTELAVANRGSIQYYRPIEWVCGEYHNPA